VSTASQIRTKVQECIRNSLKSSLGLDDSEIQNAMPFSDYGLDSILGVQLVRTLNEQLGTRLDTTVIFDHSSVIRLTGYICSTYAAALDKHISAPSPIHEVAQSDPSALDSVMSGVDTHAMTVSQSRLPTSEPIAIIGVSGKFPQSEDAEMLWDHLLHGRDLVTDVTRWSLPDETTAPKACRKGGFLDGIDQFDPLFLIFLVSKPVIWIPSSACFLSKHGKPLSTLAM